MAALARVKSSRPNPRRMASAEYGDVTKVVPMDRQTVPAYTGGNFRSASTPIMIPRRGLERQWARSLGDLRNEANDSPLRLLTYLPDIHPAVGLAAWNCQRLSIPAEGVPIIAVKEATDGTGGEITDAEGTKAIKDLWKSLPREYGGLAGLQNTLMLQALFTGLVCIEGVPAKRLKGVARAIPVDALTIGFGRDNPQADVTPYQRQVQGGSSSNWKRLNTNTFFWRALDNWVDQPEGRSPYATVLPEVLADLAMLQDLRDAVHFAAWPRYSIGFNWTETYKIAREVMGISDPKEAAAWAQTRFEAVVKYIRQLKADDAIIHDTNGSASTLPAGDFQGTQPILAYLRQRIVWALKQLPSMMGISEGTTETYTTVQWRVYGQSLETLRCVVVDPLVEVANLHLRLLGLSCTAKALYDPIRTTDALIEAQVEAARIANAQTKRNEEWITQTQASIEVSGSAEVGPGPDPTRVSAEKQVQQQKELAKQGGAGVGGSDAAIQETKGNGPATQPA